MIVANIWLVKIVPDAICPWDRGSYSLLSLLYMFTEVCIMPTSSEASPPSSSRDELLDFEVFSELYEAQP